MRKKELNRIVATKGLPNGRIERKVFRTLNDNPVKILNFLNSRFYEFKNPALNWLDANLENNFDQFVKSDINLNELVNKLYSNDKDTLYVLTKHFDKFMEAGVNFDPKRFASDLIAKKYLNLLMMRLSNFVKAGAGIDPTKFARLLILKGNLFSVALYLDEFLKAGARINLVKMAEILLSDTETADREHGLVLIASHLDLYLDAGANIDPCDLALELISTHQAAHIISNKAKFIKVGLDERIISLAQEKSNLKC